MWHVKHALTGTGGRDLKDISYCASTGIQPVYGTSLIVQPVLAPALYYSRCHHDTLYIPLTVSKPVIGTFQILGGFTRTAGAN